MTKVIEPRFVGSFPDGAKVGFFLLQVVRKRPKAPLHNVGIIKSPVNRDNESPGPLA